MNSEQLVRKSFQSLSPQYQTALNTPTSHSKGFLKADEVIMFQTQRQSKDKSSSKGTLKSILSHQVSPKPHSQQSPSQSYITKRPLTQGKHQRFKQPQSDFIDFNMNKLMPIDDKIQEIYTNFSKNYQLIADSDKIKPVTESNQVQEQQEEIPIIYQPQERMKIQDLEFHNNQMKIVRFQFYYYRIKVQQQVSPCQIFFNCPNFVQCSNIKIFISSKAQFPNIFNAEYAIQAKFTKIFAKGNATTFAEEYLYITLYSDIDFEINIIFNFGNQVQKMSIRPKSQEQIFEYPVRPQSQKIVRTDKIKENVNLSQYTSKNLFKRQFQISVNLVQNQCGQLVRQQIAKTRKLQIQSEANLQKMSQYLAKEQIQNFRHLEQQLQIKRQKEDQLQSHWMILVSVINLAAFIDNELKEAKRLNKVKARGMLLAWTLKTHTLIQVKENGNTPKERTIFKSAMVCKILASAVKKKTKHASNQIISKFMQQIGLLLTIVNKHQQTLKKIIYIQRKFKAAKLKKKTFKDKIWRLIKDNIAQTIQDLRASKYTSLYLENLPKQMQIDIPMMTVLIDKFSNLQRQRWLQYINQTVMTKDLKQKIKDIAINFKEPTLYELPNQNELTDIIQEYALMKKLL